LRKNPFSKGFPSIIYIIFLYEPLPYWEIFFNRMNVADICDKFVYVRGIVLNELTLVKIVTASKIMKNIEGYALPIIS